ncbi:tRNA-I(6)A37 thiotransferase enzyme MiaB [Candidatus Magnetoovum chiemensis]|nr:tRNA-I(6)A37 thiotransferase enzyme MiaB [Candidatus Magnetoovum chiemensis]
MKQAYLQTWGCQMNFHDTERMSALLQKEGYELTDNLNNAQLIIFNTCSIREKAQQKFYSRLGELARIKKENPTIKIGIAGCIAAQDKKDLFKHFPYIDFLIGPQNISKLPTILNENSRACALDDSAELANINIPAVRKYKIKAWVNIMYGCNNFCSYCIVPYTRGREVSRPFNNIIDEIIELADNGYKEVTLLGQNVNSYKGGCAFSELLNRINEIKAIERIRFITSHPKDFNTDLISAMANLSKVCEHIHLPLQSGSSKVLKSMNRKYSFDEYLEKITALREKIPHTAITSDIICGYPDETDDDHYQTMDALEKIQFDGIFAFKYSPRPYTKAALMPCQITEDKKTQRLSEVLTLQDKITEAKNKMLENHTIEILAEGKSETDALKWTGRTRTNKIANFTPSNNTKEGMAVQAKVIKALRHSLECELSEPFL